MAEGNSDNIFCLYGHISSIAVTGHTVAGDTESAIAIMAGTAGLAVFHLLHAGLVTVRLGFEDVRMALIAAKRIGMHIMTEKDFADRALHGDRACTRMTITAVTIYTKGAVSVMAGTTRLALFHFFHANLVAVALRQKKIGVTFVAAKHVGVNVVTEHDFFGNTVVNFHITGVAGGTVSTNTESFSVIMTKTAGFAAFHLRHGEGRTLLGDNVKGFIVTGRAILADGLHLHMGKVAKLYLAYRVSLQVDFILDPTTVQNGRESHHYKNCEYHPTPCHKSSSISKFGQHYTDFTCSANFLI
jgi:hypothetical protein